MTVKPCRTCGGPPTGMTAGQVKKNDWQCAECRSEYNRLYRLGIRVPRRPGSSMQEALERNTIPEALTSCWLCWAGDDGGMGYSILKINRHQWKAHRASWTVHRGPIPESMSVLHRCDTPRCVNPDHLFLGTYRDNAQDMAKKGRRFRFVGEANGRAKLSAEDILAIRADERLQRVIGADYGVNQTTISDIKRGRSWSPDTCGQ